MSILRPFLEFFIVSWTAWVLVFQFAIATRIPTRWLPWLFFAGLVIAVAPWGRSWWRSLGRVRKSDRRFLFQLAVVATVLAGIVLVSSRPDADDLGYLRGPLIDAAAPDKPIRVDRFRWDDRPWPVLRVLNENEAFEPFVVMASRLIGLDPLVGYHNVFLIFNVFVWCAVLAALLHHFRTPRRWLAGGVLLSAGLLFFDGGTHYSMGNMTLIRLWQGKIVAWTIVLPLFVFLQLRFLARPRLSRFALVVMAALVGVTFNRSMVVMVVLAGTAVPIAYAVAFGLRRQRLHGYRLRKVAWALTAPAPGWILGILVIVLVLRKSPDGLFEALAGWSTSIAGAVVAFERIAGGAWAIVLRDLLLLVALPLFVVPRPLGRWLAAFSGVLILISYVPPIGGLFSMALGKSVWRLYHVLPLPLCLGLLVLACRPGRGSPPSQHIGRWLAAALAVGFIALPVFNRSWVLSSKNGVEWKAPFAYRLPSGVREFVRVAGPQLENQRVLAAEDVAVALGLTHFDTVGLIATRVHYARKERVPMLIKANRALSECVTRRAPVAAIRELLDEGPELLVFADCNDADLSDDEALVVLNQALAPIHLTEAISAGGYRLIRVERPSGSHH